MRYFALALVLLTLLSLPGCKEKKALSPARYSVELITENSRSNGVGVTLVYPEIQEYGDDVAEERVNTLLKDYAYAMFKRENLFAGEDYTFEYAVTQVEITLQMEGFLSACVGGYIVEEQSGNQENFSYTVNCDLERALLYETKDLLSDYSRLASLFEKGRFTKAFGHPNLMDYITYEEMIGQYKAEYGIYPDVYFTESALGFVMDVVPMFSGYAGFTLPLNKAADSLQGDNPLVIALTE